MLLNFYGFWSGLTLLLFKIVENNPPLLEQPITQKCVQFAAGALEASFAVSMLAVFGGLLADLGQNRTKIQRMRNDQGISEYTCKQSMREVCGEGSIACWICPTPAFDESLVITDDDGQSAS
jgi:hypothetical protein